MTMYGLPLFCALALCSVPAQANISFTIAPEHCSNADGSVNATVTGGVPPYSYSWSSGPTSEDIYGLPAGSYTLTVTDFLGAQQVNTAVVQNLPNWEWNPAEGLAQAIPFCDGSPGGVILFGGDIPSYPMGPGPHQTDMGCVSEVQPQDLPADLQGFGFLIRTICYWGSPGQTYAVNYTDANGCPGYMEAIVPQPPQFYPITVLDIEGSCSGGANGRALFSIPPEPDYIYGLRPVLYNDQWQINTNFAQYLSTNWTGGWTYDVPDLAAGTYAIVRRLLHDTDFDVTFGGCGDTTYFTIPDLGPSCGGVSGSVLVDTDEDCAVDFSDVAIPEMILEFTPGPYYATTNTQGEYSINLPFRNYSVTQQSVTVGEHCLGVPSPLAVAGSMTFNLLDTALMSKDVQLTMASGPARPGFQLGYAIDLDNLTSATSQLNSLVMTFDANVSYVSATPSPSSVVGNTITWANLGSLYYFGHRDVIVQLQVPPDVALIGTDLQASAVLTSNGDVNAANNSVSWTVTVTGSYDPNDKVATTSSGYSGEFYFIDVDQWVDYTIRFQNTGTDTAFTVVVTDTLPETLDPSTLVVGAGSHPFTWSVQGAGTLKFYFVNILLPDSNVNEPGSHGFVSFRIRPRQPLLPATVIENTANIYFDFNPPVITEPSVLVAEFSTGVAEVSPSGLRLSPNPAVEVLTVYLPEGAPAVLVLLTVDGRPLQVPITRRDDALQLDVRSLAPGVYLLRTETGMARFVKQ